MKLASYLFSQKEKSGLKLRELAQRADVSISHLHDIKTGRRRPSLGVAARIEAATDGQVKPLDMLGS